MELTTCISPQRKNDIIDVIGRGGIQESLLGRSMWQNPSQSRVARICIRQFTHPGQMLSSCASVGHTEAVRPGLLHARFIWLAVWEELQWKETTANMWRSMSDDRMASLDWLWKCAVYDVNSAHYWTNDNVEAWRHSSDFILKVYNGSVMDQ